MNSESIGNLPIPNFPNDFQETVDVLVQESAILREEATNMLRCAEKLLKSEASLKDLSPEDYEYFGPRVSGRKLSVFTKSIKEIGTITINAFNHSKRIQILKDSICCHTQPLKETIENGQTFSSIGAPSVEVAEGKGIMLINQKDIFDNIVKGKWISKRGVKIENLVEYGEVIIASDGTLGENELFCRTLFANESLVGSFLSSHFIRMKTKPEVPSGYLYCWLNSDYGFRFIRNTQAGTKICHPINKLLLEIPVPIIARDKMEEIDRMVREAHTMRYQANQKELKAIAMVEAEIEKWKNKNSSIWQKSAPQNFTKE